MRPIRHPLVPGPGHRTRQTELLISERDALIREAAKFFPSMSNRETARRLCRALSTYCNGRWQRDRSEATCPAQHRGKLVRVLWLILKTSDHVPSEMTIRRALGYS